MNLYVSDGRNLVPVVLSLSLVTEPGEGWKGERFIGTFESIEELNKAINAVEIPLYWELKVDIQDKE